MIVFRVDSSVRIGSGHLMRCRTLAEELKQRGAEVHFICRRHSGNLIELLRETFPLHELPPPPVDTQNASDEDYAAWLGVSQVQDAADTIAALQGERPDWLIVDHYSLDKSWETALRPHIGRIMVIDDLANRAHDCDLLLDQNLYADMETRYTDLVPSHCQLLLGPKYALLRPEFREARKNLRTRDGTVKRILVFFGGTDPTNETAKVIQALKLLELDCTVDVVVGGSNPHKARIKQACADLGHFNYHEQINNMAELMAQADLAIGAGGSATWERCCLGVPTLVTAIAENQKKICEALHAKEAVYFTTNNIELSQELIEYLLGKTDLLKHIAYSASALTDGRGSARVAASVVDVLQITIFSDSDSWINKYLSEFFNVLSQDKYRVTWVHDIEQFSTLAGDIAFFLSCSQIVPPIMLHQHTHNLVVHESDLPQGKGWSPLTWQILEGKNDIPICLFEADVKVDNGDIYFKELIHFNGRELVGELRAIQAATTIRLCHDFIKAYPQIIRRAKPQSGTDSFYPRRKPQHSQLDPNQPISMQFNLLRVVDNDKYPAFFIFNNQKFILKIEKA
jgi:UDP-2,4-diacetamido-2,4,6-trideoxy-beta-L-altropyranose hydrolase